jgi:hypothetical protein
VPVLRSQGFRAAALTLIAFAPVHSPASSGAAESPAQDRLASCDAKVALAAVQEVVSRPENLEEPMELFSVAPPLFHHGQKDEAVFWFYAAQLRTRYQLVFEQGDRGQLFQIMLMSIGPLINSYAFQDVSKLDRTLDRVLEWDRTTPNPYREKPRSAAVERQIDQVYAGLLDMKVKLVSGKDDLERNARLTAPEMERAYADAVKGRCSKDQVKGR